MHELDTISELLKANCLTLNVSKTKFCVFTTQPKLNVLEDLKLFIDGVPIERVHCMKYIGLMLDKVLSFIKHVDYLHSKVSAILSLLERSRKCLDCETSLTLYKSLVLLYFDFGDMVYSATMQNKLDHLQKLQNSACRIIFLLNRDASICQMHSTLNILYLPDQRFLHLGVEYFKSVYLKDTYFMGTFMNLVTNVMHRATKSGYQQVMRVSRRWTNISQKRYCI